MAAPTTQQIFDDLFDSAGKAVSNAAITAVLNADFATSISQGVVLVPRVQNTTTDSLGHWALNLVPTTDLLPAGLTYAITTPERSYNITVGAAGPYRSTAVGTIVPR